MKLYASLPSSIDAIEIASFAGFKPSAVFSQVTVTLIVDTPGPVVGLLNLNSLAPAVVLCLVIIVPDPSSHSYFLGSGIFCVSAYIVT